MKHAVILGAQSGLAQQAVKQLQGNGYQVYACDIQYQTFEKKPGIIRIPIDVTDCLSLEKARKTIEHETDSLDLFTSFAGRVTIGTLIRLPGIGRASRRAREQFSMVAVSLKKAY